ncbi:MAG: hypothetical protein ACHREM_20790 [Polyangiales bacterium]
MASTSAPAIRYKTHLFTPYRVNMGPSYRLRVWLVGRDPKSTPMVPRMLVGYELTQFDKGFTRQGTLLFRGTDYSPSPMARWDSKESMAGLMGFLTLKPGDTDDDYFKKYTPEQKLFARTHAESLSMAAIDEFGEF